MRISGTLINYYFHCQRQCWLFAKRINLEDNSEDVKIGRVLHELNHERDKNTEISIDSVKIDKITGDYLVELKKSDADLEAARWQVLLYLKILKDKGIDKKGRIEVLEKNKQEKKTHYVELTKEAENQLNELSHSINGLIYDIKPPMPVLKSKCKKCAYYEYCFI